MASLPPPATGAELYLAAILEELRALRKDLAQRPSAPPSPAAPVELREPQRTVREPDRPRRR